MNLINIQNGKRVGGKIVEIEKRDFARINMSPQFKFDWLKEASYQIYKLVFETGEIIGLISLIDYPDEYRIHINLIEIAIKHRGNKKGIDGIAGCLIAFSVEIAFEKNYGGFVSLVPKTRLISLYVDKYYFIQFGRQLGLTPGNASTLIQKYLKDERK